MIQNILRTTFATVALMALYGTPAMAEPKNTKMDVKDVVVGTGDEAVHNSKVQVHYTGWLMDGTKFDSSRDRCPPKGPPSDPESYQETCENPGVVFSFTLGAREVIPGWDMGVLGMKVGGKRELIIPPELAYGKRGAGSAIPADSTLKFEVELMGIALPNYTDIDNAQLKEMMARGVPVIDLRREEEWKKTGIIEGSHMVTAFDSKGRYQQSFLDGIQKVAGTDDEVILICRTGNRTAAMSRALADQVGYKKVFNVTKGITRWIKDGNPIVKVN